jgi:hypothetical protein
LYLARRDASKRLEITAGHRLAVTPGVKGPHPEYLMIEIVNIGRREAQITNIGWKVGLLRQRFAVHITTNDGMSSTIPVRLRDGEEARFFTPLNGQSMWLQNFARDFLLPFPKIKSRFVKVRAFTSVSRNFEKTIEQGLREKLVEAARSLPKAGSE